MYYEDSGLKRVLVKAGSGAEPACSPLLYKGPSTETLSITFPDIRFSYNRDGSLNILSIGQTVYFEKTPIKLSDLQDTRHVIRIRYITKANFVGKAVL